MIHASQLISLKTRNIY